MPPIRFLLISCALASTALAVPLSAQVARPVVQAVPGGGLNAALSRLARNPRDIDALIEAGVASLAAGDGEAAIGFYQKADALSPDTARIKAGLAGAYVLTGDPVSALPLFDAAERLGMIDGARVADRALAFDMVGDAVTAQRYYHEALMAGPNDETSRRLALSQAISGDRRGMEVTLGPLLQRQDKAAWRTRAFALSILGQAAEAESIARSTMPADMAAAMTNYLRYMTKLTPAQQAAAANLGQFPRAAEIGRDDPRFAMLVRSRPVLASATPARAATTRLAQRDEKKDRKDRKAQQADAPIAPIVNRVESTPEPVALTASGELPPVRSATLATAMPQPVKPAVNTAPPALAPTLPSPAPSVMSRSPVPASTATAPALPVPAPVKPQPGFATLDNPALRFDLKPSTPALASAAPASVAPAPKPVAVAAPPVPASRPAAAKPVPAVKARSLAEVFADLSPPSREAEPKAGAVDLRKIKVAATPAKLTAAEAKAAKAGDASCDVPDPKAAKTAKGAKGKPAIKALPAQCKDTKDEKAKGPNSPSRIWVQVATGRDRKALAFDWRRLAKDEAALFKGRKPFISAWGQTNRLLTGPFDTAAQANTFVSQLKKAGVDGAFPWNSPAGQVVDALPGS
ncbi:SPOR domain-containing protein [Novosphingobium aquiterrae]|uniref:SPOR domain-containing protein n=1 Tax=Novosphingobium aquiterrae TaxID=624388 RepID=A0ABV6PEZ5_9SPHN